MYLCYVKKTPGSDTAPTDNEIRIANANKILKEVEEMDKKAKKYGTINLRAYQEYRKEKMDKYYMLQSKIE